MSRYAQYALHQGTCGANHTGHVLRHPVRILIDCRLLRPPVVAVGESAPCGPRDDDGGETHVVVRPARRELNAVVSGTRLTDSRDTMPKVVVSRSLSPCSRVFSSVSSMGLLFGRCQECLGPSSAHSEPRQLGPAGGRSRRRQGTAGNRGAAPSDDDSSGRTREFYADGVDLITLTADSVVMRPTRRHWDVERNVT